MALHRRIRTFIARRFVARRIRTIALKAEAASSRYRGSLCARAGDLARDAGLRQEALNWYGQAIDAYLTAGRGRAAELICERVLAAYPEVIRARYTMTLIAIGQHRLELARDRFREYWEVVSREQPTDVAVAALLQMASVTSDPELRGDIHERLVQAGRSDLARMVGAGDATDEGGRPVGLSSWSRAVAAALRRPDEIEVKARSDLG